MEQTEREASSMQPETQMLLDEIREVRKDVADLRVDVATLKTKSRVWGSLAGLFSGGAGAGLAKLITMLSEGK